MTIKAIIYDMDGLLVDSEILHQEAERTSLLKYGFRREDLPQEIIGDFVGRTLDEVADITCRFFGLDDRKGYIRTRKEEFYKLIDERLELMAGAMKSLELFKKNGLKIALGTSATKEYAKIVLKKFSIGGYFDALVTAEDVTKGKPEPEPYILAADKLGVKPSECVVLEDASNGIKAAKAAGCRCIAVPNKHAPCQRTDMADLVLDSLEDIDMDKVREIILRKKKING